MAAQSVARQTRGGSVKATQASVKIRIPIFLFTILFVLAPSYAQDNPLQPAPAAKQAVKKASPQKAADRSLSQDSSAESEPKLTPRLTHSVADLKKEIDDLRAKHLALEENFEKLGSEVDVLREQSRLMVQRMSVGFRDLFYLRLGAAI